MTATPNAGVKDNKHKPRLSLFPMRAFQWAGKVFTFGAAKYAPYNWAKGLPHSELMDATLRHLTDYWAGEDDDPESGHSHLAHALCCVAMLLESKLRGIGTDDRWEWNPAQKLAAQLANSTPETKPSPAATRLAIPRCLHEGCLAGARPFPGDLRGPFCKEHEAIHDAEWNVCEAPNCVRWVKVSAGDKFRQCSKHAKDHRKSRDFMGGQHP